MFEFLGQALLVLLAVAIVAFGCVCWWAAWFGDTGSGYAGKHIHCDRALGSGGKQAIGVVLTLAMVIGGIMRCC
jgi:hypothetical protein